MTKYIYNNCPKKHEARYITISSLYKEIYQTNYFPIDKQYITLSAKCNDFNDETKLLDGCELSQLMKENFLTSQHKIICIDKNENIVSSNKKIVGLNNIDWYCGQLDNVIYQLSGEKYYNPGIINCDFTQMPSQVISCIEKILFLNKDIINLMVVCNLVIKCRFQHEITDEQLSNIIHSSDKIIDLLNSNEYKLYENSYSYNGTGPSSKTKMKTIILYK